MSDDERIFLDHMRGFGGYFPISKEEEIKELVSIIDSRDALIERLRTELAALHKVVINAMAALPQALFAKDFGEVDAATVINAVIDILDSAPEPSDETLRLIEDTGGDDAQR